MGCPRFGLVTDAIGTKGAADASEFLGSSTVVATAAAHSAATAACLAAAVARFFSFCSKRTS